MGEYFSLRAKRFHQKRLRKLRFETISVQSSGTGFFIDRVQDTSEAQGQRISNILSC